MEGVAEERYDAWRSEVPGFTLDTREKREGEIKFSPKADNNE